MSTKGREKVRVNIESSALAEGRFTKLSEETFEGSRCQAIGCLVLFWHDSQEREFVSGSKKEIMKFLPYYDNKGNNLLFKAFLKHGYIKKISNTCFEISGNKQHVENLQKLKAIKRKAGLASADSRKNKSEHVLNTIEHVLPSVDGNTTQCSSTQPNSTQSKIIAQNQFEQLYEIYPRKLGKKKGFQKLKTVIKDQNDFDRVRVAIENYCKFCQRHKTEPQYIKHFSTFMGTWEDWLEVKVEEPKKRQLNGEITEKEFNELNKPFPETNPKVLELIKNAKGKML